MTGPRDSLGLLSGSLLALACVPRVPATITIDPNKTPEPDEPEAEPRASKKDAPARTRTGPDSTPPRVVRAEQLGDNLLRLHFSEPVTPPDDFDPNDFRLSVFNLYVNPRAGYSYAYYYDFGYQFYGQAMRFTGVRAGETELDLYFTPTVSQSYCRQFEYAYAHAPPGARVETALFLHYAAGSVPIHDAAGNALANFGADWVLRGRSDPPQSRRELSGAEVQGAGQGLLRVSCGPELPPGPR